ncbi:MAG TPA: TRAP transporter substrate-binding protein [Bacillota bacterium]|nr:TRAP transporter substrate-binding protein [Bacillota bacterium]
MKKRVLAILLVVTMAMLAACSAPAPAPSTEAPTTEKTEPAATQKVEYTIKIGHSDTVTNLLHVSLEHFADYVFEKTNGRVKVDIYAAESLGSNAEMSEMVSMGNLDCIMMPAGQEAVYAPKIAALGLPFLFANYEQVYKVLDSEVGESLVKDLANHNMIQLSYWENGLRQITNSVRPIEKPEDLKGLKIRTPEDKMTLAIFKALGASPSPLAFSELYLALQQGTFDGQENPVSNIYANKFQDVQKYITISNHKYEPKNMIFSLSTWNKLPEDIKAVLLEASKIYGKEHRKAIADSADSMLKELEAAGMKVSRPDTTVFQEATKSVYTDFYAQNDWAEDIVKQIKDIIATVK